ncbi:MAG: D-2-hydroxyacid dehydrogenase [Treponema sp.]|jgi:D-3-phosphoglycerate dehydrogenase|nr:D-2-hydroxyacid dehydrogenase [Treponema sp.]
MVRILATDGIESSAAKALSDLGFEVVQQFYDENELPAKAAEYDVVVVRSATKIRKPVIDAAAAAGKLKLVIRGGVGIDNIDAVYAKEKGIDVQNTPLASSASVAELAIAHMFSLARFIYDANVTMRAGKWEKKRYEGSELAGKTLGLIGMGRIGRCTAKMAAALGMKVIYTNRKGPLPENEPFVHVFLDDLLAKSDFVSLHMPKSDGPVLSAENIAKMKDGVFLINTARAALVDTAAMLKALDSGKIAGAALDVFDEEPIKDAAVYTHPKISMTPHIGASTVEAQQRIGEDIVSIISEKFKS